MTRQVNAAALAIIDSTEGCVLHAYRDCAGVLTAGWGHAGPDVKAGMVVTQSQADAWRAADLARAADFVAAHVRVSLTDNQFSALAEFTYNVGVGNFLGSRLLRFLNRGEYGAVPGELMRWTVAGGRIMPGLVARRAREAALFAATEPLPAPVVTPLPPDALCTPGAKPVAPSLAERARAWLHQGAAGSR